MKNEATVNTLVYWLTQNTSAVVQLLGALIPVLSLLVLALLIYAVFWKGGSK